MYVLQEKLESKKSIFISVSLICNGNYKDIETKHEKPILNSSETFAINTLDQESTSQHNLCFFFS